jgi:hypothetical protein
MRIQIDGIVIEPTAQQTALGELAWAVLPHFLSFLASKTAERKQDEQTNPDVSTARS